jgi:hypothetical protein
MCVVVATKSHEGMHITHMWKKAFVAAVMRLSFYEIYQRGLYHVALLATFNVVT